MKELYDYETWQNSQTAILDSIKLFRKSKNNFLKRGSIYRPLSYSCISNTYTQTDPLPPPQKLNILPPPTCRDTPCWENVGVGRLWEAYVERGRRNSGF